MTTGSDKFKSTIKIWTGEAYTSVRARENVAQYPKRQTIIEAKSNIASTLLLDAY